MAREHTDVHLRITYRDGEQRDFQIRDCRSSIDSLLRRLMDDQTGRIEQLQIVTYYDVDVAGSVVTATDTIVVSMTEGQ